VTTDSQHVDFLDYMRAIAFLSVFAYHSTSIADHISWGTWFRDFQVSNSSLVLFPLNFGWLGVAVFFVVSGFCIHFSFHQHGRGWANFFLRRFFRLYPAYLAAVLLFAFLIPETRLHFSASGNPQGWSQLITHLLLIHNFNRDTYYGINSAFWSLAVEVQLYLLYPVLVLMVSRLGWRRSLCIVGTIESAIHIAKTVLLFNAVLPTHFLTKFSPALLEHGIQIVGKLNPSPLAFWFSWSLGAWVADAYLKNKLLPLVKTSTTTWFACVVACFIFRPLSEFIFPATCLLTAAVISHLLVKQPVSVSRSNLLRQIGTWSYSLYLLHQPMLAVLTTNFLLIWPFYYTLPRVLFCLTLGLMIIPAGMLWYKYIEQPGIALGKSLIVRLGLKGNP
jgi:peptidoglycan/LPS O-acetylase OafA/YrhL